MSKIQPGNRGSGKLNAAARAALAKQEKQFQLEKKWMALANQYHELQQQIVWASNARNVAAVTKLQYAAMNILLQYTLGRGLFSTNVAIREIAAFNRGKQIYGLA